MKDHAEKFREVLETAAPKRKAARFRMLFPGISMMFAQGYSQLEVNEALSLAGFELTFVAFRSMLYRERRRASGKNPGRAADRVLQMNSAGQNPQGSWSQSNSESVSVNTGAARYDHTKYRNREPKW